MSTGVNELEETAPETQRTIALKEWNRVAPVGPTGEDVGGK